ncbi:Outer membrane receptor proteins, mostly Fe transport [Pedobacter steynii]|uniref:Outer membrane receptor proteins, mostly Fe transport n=2 Tax=Pedobacter steynii TaxID=430522 RepID=A0A1G9N6F6_9SPHI|nr:TonB-dependent receptor [Pedobacter steynii]SDL82132.1 Outer membrane receptor proteins, mostly Fe transport [Pedobacter steynii]
MSLILLGWISPAFSQQQVRSSIIDANTGTALTHAAVKLTQQKDTTVKKSGITDSQGLIVFDRLQKGDYHLQIHAIGYMDTLIHFSIPAGKFNALPGTIYLRPDRGIQLKEVVIKDDGPAVSMKGDTIEYNAAKFKTKDNAVVEDLLRKLPGVNIDKTGTIKAQGEVVQRVLVDGKEFFGSDPSIATRNLPADMIQKVQVLDKNSDMAEFTGVADGKQQKTINLITKKNRKRGYFGNLNGGLGDAGHYEAGLNVNSFVNEAQMSLIMKGNDVNKSGFSTTELIRLLSQNPEMFNSLPPSALSELTKMKSVKIEGNSEALAELARPSGLTDTKYGGLNFNNDWSDRLKLRSSYFFNDNRTTDKFDNSRQYLLQQSPYNYLQSGTKTNHTNNKRIDLSTDVKLSNRSSIKISPRVNLSNADRNSDQTFSSATVGTNPVPLNDGTQLFKSNSSNNIVSGNTLFKHRLTKAGRTLVFETTPEYFQSKSNYLNQSANNLYTDNRKTTENTDQQTLSTGNIYNLNNNLVYTEPISSKYLLQAGQQFYYSHGKYLRQVNNRNVGNGNYDNPVPALSDNYTSDRIEYNSKLSVSGNYKKFNYTVGAGFKQSQVRGSSLLRNYRVDQHYRALLPSAYATYKVSASQKLVLNYAMETNMPSVSNLQPIEDNIDPLFTRKGNPDLGQEKSQRLSLAFNSFQLGSGNSVYASFNLNWFNQQITDHTITDATTGKQLITPVNVSGNYRYGLNMGKTIRLDGNGSSLTAEVNGSYSKSSLMNNNLLSNIRTLSVSPELSVNYYLGNKVSFSGRGSASWNTRRFSRLTTLPAENWLLSYGLESIVILPLKMSLEGSIDGFSTPGLSKGYNTNVMVLNTGLNKEFGKQFSVKAEARDLLNRNQSISRVTGNGYIEDKRNNALGRYFQLSAVYKFRHFPKSNKK